MKRLSQLTAIGILAVLMAAPVFADTLVLKGGERVSGYFEGGCARVVKFRTGDGVVKDYDILSVQAIHFGESNSASTSSTSRLSTANPAPATDPRLRTSTERPPAQPSSGTAANTAYTIPTGTKVTVRMIDTVNSEVQKLGDPFVAVLDESILYNGGEVV